MVAEFIILNVIWYVNMGSLLEKNKFIEKEKTKLLTLKPMMDRDLRVEIDEILLNCIISGGLPYNHFENPWFGKLFDRLQPGYIIPDRRTFANRVRQRYHAFVEELKTCLPKDYPVAFTTDTWKNASRNNFICLTVHIFNSDMQIVSLLLSFCLLTDRKLSKNLNEYLRHEIEKFGLTANIKAATSSGEFGIRFSCVAHLLNLVISNGLFLWKPPKSNW